MFVISPSGAPAASNPGFAAALLGRSADARNDAVDALNTRACIILLIAMAFCTLKTSI
jgi:hypothetical protein